MRQYVEYLIEMGTNFSKSKAPIKNKQMIIDRISSLVSNWQLVDKSTYIKEKIKREKKEYVETLNLEKDKIHMAKVHAQHDRAKAREKAYYKSVGL